MLISIITINYNNLIGLRRTVASVKAQIYKDFEYIIIDGSSTDGSREFIEEQSGIDQWISEPDKGVYEAMNKGIQRAHGDYCLFLNSGDILFSPDTLEQVVGQLGDCDIYTGVVTFLDGVKTYSHMPPEKLTFDFLLTKFLSHPATFNRTEWLRKHPYREDYRIVSDWELYLRACLEDCSYAPLPNIMISIFVCDGLSAKHAKQIQVERKKVLDEMISNMPEGPKRHEWETKTARYYSHLRTDASRNTQQLAEKLERAMKLSPIKRDLKILRNAAKCLLRDIFA